MMYFALLTEFPLPLDIKKVKFIVNFLSDFPIITLENQLETNQDFGSFIPDQQKLLSSSLDQSMDSFLLVTFKVVHSINFLPVVKVNRKYSGKHLGTLLALNFCCVSSCIHIGTCN